MKIKTRIASSSILFFSACLAQMAFSASPATFSDVNSSHANYTAIMDLKERGIISGYPDGTFKPDQAVNRVEALKIILLGAGITEPATSVRTFSDTSNTEWYSKSVELGIVQGYPDGSFKPAQTVNLVENLKMLLEAEEITLADTTPAENPYADTPKTEWYANYVLYAKDHNLIDADSENNVYPDQGMTRGKLAESLYRIIYMNEKGLQTFDPEEQNTQEVTEEDYYLEISILDTGFKKAELTSPVGGTVRWTNNDTVNHTVTSDSGSELNSGILEPGDTYIHTFNSEDTFNYHCEIHPSMTGTVTTKPANEVPTI